MAGAIEKRVDAAVDAWLRWVPGWSPGTHRGRARLCRRCTGSPILAAAGVSNDVPHQVTHALVSRMQRIIDRRVDEFTEQELPALHAELTGAELWQSGGYDPAAGLAPEYEGLDPDPEPADGEQPFLFTLAGLAEETRPEPPLPRPPLSAEEKQRLRREIELADRCAEEAGREVCFALVTHRPRIQAAIQRFVEPQIRAMLDDLSRNLEPPQ
ncbi:spermidine/putrescine ABC transporter substrate-binding protein [Leucobacter triazinivorans]|uniref:Spermidine/putrescine ABC transporter substrate-binding protein n=1 Tax=Leucobacter triazinivorans TaxID=1784719 RepID=A0A4P6KCQ3_9MICO|nr:spermidine/putrescine ABC transporter substrate-binding protein [Leucobacter triazinivorans]QBE48126.1 spermidine/putrescine ABC transporter substrate-binding protein [Leucobacter triazinivorans]